MEKQLIQALNKKSNQVSSLDLAKTYEDFSKVVTPQLSYTIRLFEEYTPHDVDNHIDNLHRIAFEILGEKIINTLNATECFILCCALIGHDWGMAISRDEQERIKRLTSSNHQDPSLLPDEKNLLDHFIISNQNLSIEDSEFWTKYIRDTHQVRAKHRIINYFEDKDYTLGRIVGDVSEGHGLNIEEIMKYDGSESVCGQLVNTKCIAIYVRTIDLLDIAKDRTPYSLWKFVNPVDNTSNLEWKKHLTLNSISVSSGHMKIVHIHGETADHQVYYALQDMHKYVSSQITENLEALKIHDGYSIWFDIDWKIKSIGFEPVSVRFEFDRHNIFNILSSEIYEGDPLVFIRELIQNSTDAIRVKQEKLKKLGQALNEKVIDIQIENTEAFDVVTVKDCGIGMDEYIIKNYLSLIGKSYYNSNDFYDLGLNMDSISRFGIGILSCFSVADKVEIETKHYDSDCGFKVEINHIDRHFKVSRNLNLEKGESGTSVRVYVDADKWKTGSFQEFETLDFSQYVCSISYLRDIRIRLQMSGKRWIIPASDEESSDNSTEEDIIKTHEFGYNELGFTDFENFDYFYNSKRIEINQSDNFFRITGQLHYAVPKNLSTLYTLRNPGNDFQGVTDRPQLDLSSKKLKWNREYREAKGNHASIRSLLYCKVFYKGIFMPGINPELPSGNVSPPVKLKINLDPINASSHTDHPPKNRTVS